MSALKFTEKTIEQQDLVLKWT